MVFEKEAYATVPGVQKSNDSVGKRFCSIVRDVLNFMEEVRKVECAPLRERPRVSCLGPGIGPNTTGMRQYTFGFLALVHFLSTRVEWSNSSWPKLYTVYSFTGKRQFLVFHERVKNSLSSTFPLAASAAVSKPASLVYC